MKKIIAIVCHRVTNPLVHTVKYLSTFENNTIVLHVDSKANKKDFEFLKSKNTFFTDERVNITWGGVSQVMATLELMRFSKSFSYDYFFLISGDDIPAMSNEKVDSYLYSNYGKEFIHYQDDRNGYVNPDDRIKFIYPGCFYKRELSLLDRIKRKFFHKTKRIFYYNNLYAENSHRLPTFYKGTNWFTLTKSSIDFILDYVDSNNLYLEVFRNSLCADEVFFHSILKVSGSISFYNNSNAKNNALRYIDWDSGPQYPRVLDDSDMEKIINSNSFFARKVGKNADEEFMMNCINH